MLWVSVEDEEESKFPPDVACKLASPSEGCPAASTAEAVTCVDSFLYGGRKSFKV